MHINDEDDDDDEKELPETVDENEKVVEEFIKAMDKVKIEK